MTLRFAALSCAFALLVAAHFYFAWRAWMRMRGETSAEVDTQYVRRESFIPESFRGKLREWLRLPVTGGTLGQYSLIDKGREQIRVTVRAEYGDGSMAPEILAVAGSFACGRDCQFAREIYVSRDCQIGKRSRLQAIAADGRLALGSEVTVYRWADSEGDFEMRPGACVRGRATSSQAIHFGMGAQAGSLFAPEIRTQDAREQLAVIATSSDGAALTPVRISAGELPSNPAEGAGFDISLAFPMSDDCVLYRGDLTLTAPLQLRSKLVVHGAFSCPAGSVLEMDVKVTGDVTIGADSVVAGNLVTDGNLTLGERCLFRGVLRSEGDLCLRAGVRGRRPTEPVAAYAGATLYVETNVIVAGKLAAGKRVIAVEPG